MDDREFLQRLDALRPNRSDLEQLGNTDLQERLASDGEAFELYERIQSADARIGAAFRDVESPVGLEQRILSRLVADDVNDDEEIPDDRVAVASPVGGASPVSVSLDSFPAVPASRQASRRRLIGTTIAALAAAVIAAVIFLPWRRDRPPTSLDELIGRARLFYQNQARAPGNPLSKPQGLETHPISRFVVHGQRTTCRRVDNFLGHTAVAYDIPSLTGARATLYVVQHRMQDLPLPTSPFDGQLPETGGLWSVAWQESGEDVFYVLVAEPTARNEDPLRLFLKSPWSNA